MHTHLPLRKPALLPYDFPSAKEYVMEHKKKENL
jgi:hypothetical protein